MKFKCHAFSSMHKKVQVLENFRSIAVLCGYGHLSVHVVDEGRKVKVASFNV